jgi:hypothetical protein
VVTERCDQKERGFFCHKSEGPFGAPSPETQVAKEGSSEPCILNVPGKSNLKQRFDSSRTESQKTCPGSAEAPQLSF